MTRSFGPRRRTAADKASAALQFAVFADCTDAEKKAILMRSYGCSEPQADDIVKKSKGV